MLKEIKEIFSFREVLFNFVAQELKVRYKRSVLGFLWSLLNPILTMIVTSVVFAAIMRFDLNNFIVFIYSALLPWAFISLSIEGSTMSILNAEGFIKKVYIPKIIFPVTVVASNFVNMILSMISLFAIVVLLGAKITFALLFLPISFLLVFLVTTGLSLLLSIATVYFRDIQHIIGVILSSLFYLTPILYPLSYIPEKYRIFIKFNPFYYLIQLFRDPIYYSKLPDASIIIIATIVSLGFFLLGLFIFNKYKNKIIFKL